MPKADCVLSTPPTNTPTIRQAIEDQIERLIAFLDFIDDPDLEAAGDDEDGHDFEETDGRPVLISACGHLVFS
ncbi:hypothetical protein [Tardiphaga sp.]|uniref:hypothetical protein n=1 Tax=Tardiphaga sp. TaxID=1926292 RepID=UPI00261AC92C|nr:hypothetical protein [Tardiphaga sp.]MDB5617446.1 hypothetical protein [Tardiphaga sp.]